MRLYEVLKMGNTEIALLKIGELAAMAGVSTKALRVYEKKNIIKPVQVDEETGYRYYAPDQLKQVEALIELQDMGFTLDEISMILSGKCSSEDLSSMFESKKVLLQERIWKTQNMIKEIDTIRKSIEDGKETDKLKEMSDDERAWYLAKLIRVNEENIRQVLSEILWV